MRDPTHACKLEYLRGVERGHSTSAKLEVPAELLTAGHRIWMRTGSSQPFRRVRERISVLDFTWESDLHRIDLRCFSPKSGEYRSASALLKWEPLPGWRIENKVFVSSADSAIVYMPDFNVGKVAGQPEDFWVTQKIEDWETLGLPSARWPLDREEPHGLLTFEATEGHPEKHVAIAVGRELTVGRLHLGDQRFLNQSGRGAHWHLGWQRERVDPSFQGTREDVPEALLVRCRDWMKRCAGVLELRPLGDDVGIEARSADDAGSFEVRRAGPREWELTLTWSEYRDSLRIHGEEAVVGDSQVPWFWASRCGLEPGMEDRYYLWLPWHWELLDLAVGRGGWIDSSVRWQVGRQELVFVDEGALEGTV